MSIKLLSPEDEIVVFKTYKEAERLTGLDQRCLIALKFGRYYNYKSWKSTHRKCKKKVNEWRSKYSYVNLETRELLVLTNKQNKHLLKKYCPNVYSDAFIELTIGRRIMTCNWVLRTTFELIYGPVPFSRKTFLMRDHKTKGQYVYKNINRPVQESKNTYIRGRKNAKKNHQSI